MTPKKHYHIVHQSLILDATISGVKVSWFGYLSLAGMLLFPFSGGHPLGIGLLVGVMWGLKTFLLQHFYEKDNLGVEIFFISVLWQQEFYQGQASVNAPGPVDNKSIPEVTI